MKKTFSTFIWLSTTGLLAGCGSVTVSVTGNSSPILDHPIPTTNSVLVVSALGGQANVRQSRFSFGQNFTIINLPLNEGLAQAASEAAQALGYTTQTSNLNADNPLFTDQIESAGSQAYNTLLAPALLSAAPNKGSLSPTAQQALTQLNAQTKADNILLIGYDANSDSDFYGAACNYKGVYIIYNAYMVYLIDGKTYRVLAWQEVTPQFPLPSVPFCSEKTITQTQVESTIPALQDSLSQTVYSTVKSIFTVTDE